MKSQIYMNPWSFDIHIQDDWIWLCADETQIDNRVPFLNKLLSFE